MAVGSILMYIDPGTGSLLISVLFGIIATILYSIKGLFYKASLAVSASGKKNLADYSDQIVFFSEGKAYWRVFKPVIDEMINKKQKVVYLSAEKNDEGLFISSEYVETHYLGRINQAIFILNRLRAKMCIMTTPQLDVIALKRSKHVNHYCHIIHSPTDIHAYKKFAFDFYDSVLCSSTSQITNLRYLEKQRQTKPKQLFNTGCTYYDIFKPNSLEKGEYVLLAPTWGDRTFFKQHGKEILSSLIKGGHKVILRPHPQSWISDKELMADILSSFSSNPNLIIDKETNGEKSIIKSKILICDITSGMLFDIAFAFKKPVVAINFEWADGGYESSDLVSDTAAINLLKDIGEVINVKDVKYISETINKNTHKVINEEIINKHIFNFQNSGKIATEQILSIFKALE